MAIARSLFVKIAAARASFGGNYLRDGEYLLEVRKMLIRESYKTTHFISEMHVIESADDPDAIDNPGTDKAKAVLANKVGTQASYVVDLIGKDSGPGNAKAHVLGLLGLDESDVTEDDFVDTLQDFCAANNPTRGMLLRAKSYRKPIRSGPNAGKPFTNFRWEAVEQTDEEIAERRAAADGAEKADANAR